MMVLACEAFPVDGDMSIASLSLIAKSSIPAPIKYFQTSQIGAGFVADDGAVIV
jgi:hypothetical protein